MDQHDDLLTAALDAVAAVEARSADAKDVCDKQIEQLDAQELPSIQETASDLFSDDLLDQISGPLNELNVNDEEFADLNFSLSGFGALLDNDAAEDDSSVSEVAEVENSKSEASSQTEDISETPQESDQSSKVAEFKAQIDELNVKLAIANQRTTDLQTENDQLRAIQKQLNDRVVRLTADFDNYRKRVVRDQELSKNQSEERIVTAFLPVMDNLERALGHAKQSDDYQRLLQGVEMIGRLYRDVLIKLGCVPFDSMGAEFDPVYHDVLQRVIDPEKPHNSIVQVHLRGYKMHDHVLRPALVVVAQHEDVPSEGDN